jgi:hypothetical protein
MSDEFLKKQFDLGAESAGAWALSARRLKRGGDLLFDAYAADLDAMGSGVSPLELANLEVVGPATLLFGLAIENILKAIIIDRDPQPVNDGKLRGWPAAHDLLRLADFAAIEFDDRQKDLVRRIGAFVEWAGRYPVPKKATKLPVKQIAINRPYMPLPLQPCERPLFAELFWKLWATVVIAEPRKQEGPDDAG